MVGLVRHRIVCSSRIHNLIMYSAGGGGSSSVSVNSASPNGFGSTTGSAIVSGGHAWRNLSVIAVGGALVENGYPMLGRYTSANAVINGKTVPSVTPPIVAVLSLISACFWLQGPGGQERTASDSHRRRTRLASKSGRSLAFAIQSTTARTGLSRWHRTDPRSTSAIICLASILLQGQAVACHYLASLWVIPAG